MKVAVIGAGISGMACAYYLANSHEVYLFESESRIGGHTNTIDVWEESQSFGVDTGFIVFNNKNYPNFSKLMKELNVPSHQSLMSFSVKVEKNGLEYNGTSINSLFCQRRNFLNPRFYKMIKDILRFNKEATTYYLNSLNKYHDLSIPHESISVERFAKDNNYSEEFIEYYLIPMGAALWSASRQEMRNFPLNFFVRFFYHHGMLSVDDRPQWYVISGGSKTYIPKLTQSYQDKIITNAKVSKVKRLSTSRQVEVFYNNRSDLFDAVVFANHADQVLSILDSPLKAEVEILDSFKYRPNDVLLHTDTSILPKKKLAWASWNYYLPSQERERVAVTYNMNILQGLKKKETYLVSLNMDDLIDSNKVIKKIPYTHPVFDLQASNAQRRLTEINGKDRIYYAGAYWGNGFHEDGVRSALNVSSILCKEL